MKPEIQIKVIGLVYNQNVPGTYALVMEEELSRRRFSIMIGEPEAQSIALKMNDRKSPRPLTHDLVLSVLRIFDASLEKVVIYEMINDVFFSELHMKKGEELLVVDARTSDAIAIAVRANCPIFIRVDILDVVGMEVDPAAIVEESSSEVFSDDKTEEEMDKNAEHMTGDELDMLTVDDLEELLNMALMEEKYELAASLRDALQRKKNPQNES